MRFAAVLVGAFVCLPQLIAPWPFAVAASPGPGLLKAIVSAALLLCCGACLLTADIISSERREGTLGLLLVTRLRALDVLVGKLVSAGATGLCALMAVLPLLMLPVLAGGVTGGETLRKGLVLPATLFLALAAGLLASAGGREWAKSAQSALVLVASLVLVPLLLELLFWGAPARTGVGLLSPLGTLFVAEDVFYRASPTAYWTSLLLVLGVGWVLLLGAGLRLRRAWRGERGEIATAVAADFPETGADAAGHDCRPVDYGPNPIAWLLQRQRGTQAILWAGALLSIAYTWLPTFVLRMSRTTSYWGIMPWQLAAVALDGALFAWAASRFLVEARRTGELELLLTTPAGARQLVSTQWDVLKRLLRWPILVTLVPPFLGTASTLTARGVWLGPSYSVFRTQIVISEVFYCVNTLFGVGALCWLGLWAGLRAGSQGWAIAWTVGVVKGLPYLVGILSSILFSSVGAVFPPGQAALPFLFVRSLPQIVDLLFYLTVIYVARHSLLGGLAGADPMHLDFRQAFAAAARDALAAIRRARHWTPS